MAILIKNARYVVQDADTILENADILIEGQKIAGVFTQSGSGGDGLGSHGFRSRDGSDSYEGGAFQGTVIDASGKVVMPGLINAHTHLYQNLLKGQKDGLGLKEWCEEVTFPFANVVHYDHDVQGDDSIGYHWSVLAAEEMLKGGVTCFIDMDLTVESMFRAWTEVGIRGIAAVTMVNRWVPKELHKDDDVRKKEVLDYIDKWHSRPQDHSLVDVFIAPSTPFTCTEDLLRWARRIADERDVGTQIHVSETSWEVPQCVSETGYTPLAYLSNIGFLDGHVTAVHCVHITREEIEIAARKGVIVVYNPKSNMKLGNGFAPIVELLEAGVTVALATDGAASNDLLDMFEEMRVGAMVQRGRLADPSVISAKDVFRMATVGGARAARIDAGEIKKGKLADIVVLDVGKAHSIPVGDVINTIVYCSKASDVDTVLVNGEVVVHNGCLTRIDEDAVRQHALEAAVEKLGRAKGKKMAAEF
ncbi:MAG TPA: amidohydrolase [Clostridia bacterium]|nr:amidohydrolase [Clostridia bacterium]